MSSGITRRALVTAAALGIAGVSVGAWPRLSGADIPGRHAKGLRVAILGNSADAEARRGIAEAFMREHPDIPVHLQAIQGADWKDFFAKILTMVAAGNAPDVVYVATEGTQLFAEKLAEPLDSYVQRDAQQVAEYFADVHPSLIEAFMYRGSLFQMPLDFNAANMYLNSSTLRRAGLEYPPAEWTWDDFESMMRGMKKREGRGFTPYYWTNRLFGGVVPWLYTNDTSFLTETRAQGGSWLWNGFYRGEATKTPRSGGYLWENPNAEDPKVLETFEFLRDLVDQGLAVRPEGGGGNSLVGLFANGKIGAAPAGGYWVDGLVQGGMGPKDFDVQFFPGQRSQRHQFGAAGYAIMRDSKLKDEAWEWVKFTARRDQMLTMFDRPNTTPTRRSMVNEAFYAKTGPQHWKVFYDTLDRFPTSGPIPAPPQQAAIETALMKNVTNAVGGSRAQTRQALGALQRDLELAMRSV
ncbi:extracellular solute-binding protein [Glutamicibacter sp. PS]|uniref:extracellular solute-binding protein n=1 Tax=Glutamicibacter sp. PS TaxID=3075634 RepID=UPI00283D6658|nr:extracellular solute-binding protein [Glutamicibacter sp. PS]MDR4534868.1 extracellular solute-binding protein [Glutamicibacter sp. PS]